MTHCREPSVIDDASLARSAPTANYSADVVVVCTSTRLGLSRAPNPLRRRRRRRRRDHVRSGKTIIAFDFLPPKGPIVSPTVPDIRPLKAIHARRAVRVLPNPDRFRAPTSIINSVGSETSSDGAPAPSVRYADVHARRSVFLGMYRRSATIAIRYRHRFQTDAPSNDDDDDSSYSRNARNDATSAKTVVR